MALAIEAQQIPIRDSYYSPEIKAKYYTQKSALVFQKPAQKWADIGYHPNLEQYLERCAASTKAGGLVKEVPSGWPQSLSGPLVWSPKDFVDESRFIFVLSDGEKQEINQALQHFKELKKSPAEVSSDSFLLPTLSVRLLQARSQIYEGSGLIVLRGLDVDSYDDRDAATIFLGISSYIAQKRGKQDQRGTMIGEVAVAAMKIGHVFSRYKNADDKGRGRYEMPFHSDVVCDCLALFTRNCAATGGHGTFASAWTLYNELAVNRPDILHVLAQPDWPLDTFGRDPPYRTQALLFHSAEKVILSASRRLLTGSPYTQRSEGIPGLTEAQAEALDAINFIAKDNSMRISMEKGDMRFINNMAILHARDAFEDSEATQRHLLRLWLSSAEKLGELPEPLRLAWDRVFEDHRREEWDYAPAKLPDGSYVLADSSCD